MQMIYTRQILQFVFQIQNKIQKSKIWKNQ